MRTILILSAALAGCSEYDFAGEHAPQDPTEPTSVAPDPTDPGPTGTGGQATQTGAGDRVVMACDDTYSDTMPWVRSDLWTADTEPVDAAGLSWYEPAFDDSSFAPLGGLPDEDWSSEDHDLFYRATFWLDEVVGRTEIEFVGNDGVWLYVNGGYVGHWGGGWREGGCINEPVNCGVNTEAPPVEVTDFLKAGENTVAVMLTNGPTGFYLEINATCVEE